MIGVNCQQGPTPCPTLVVSMQQVAEKARRPPLGGTAILPMHAILARTSFFLRCMRGAGGITWVTPTLVLGEMQTVWFTEPSHRVALQEIAQRSVQKMKQMMKNDPAQYVSGS